MAREHFSLNRQERRGVVVLCSLILLTWVIPSIVRQFKKPKAEDFSDFEDEVESFKAHQMEEKAASSPLREKQHTVYDADQLPDPFPFDPNTLSPEGWQKLGLSSGTIRTIQHYKEAGGRFYKKEDLKKIYGLSPEVYDHLKDYIQIKGNTMASQEQERAVINSGRSVSQPAYPKSATQTIVAIDVNQADSAEWVKLRGIGPVLSARIIKFRNALGGFYSIDQVSEVYGLQDSVFKSIRHQLNITTTALKKLNINTATVDELKSHPYINYDLAAAIKAFRDQHGSFKTVEELKQVQLVDDEIYRKLVPYLTVN